MIFVFKTLWVNQWKHVSTRGARRVALVAFMRRPDWRPAWEEQITNKFMMISGATVKEMGEIEASIE